MKSLYSVLFVILGVSCIITQVMSMHTSYGSNVAYDNVITSQSGSSQIVISRNSFSSTSQVDIMIRAPDFNSNQYGIDTIGEDDASRVIISTREGSIPYRLVES